MRDVRTDGSLEKEVVAEPGGENLYRCYSCGTCAAACLVRRVNPDFNPRKILEMVMLGMREEVLSSPVVWLCSACDVCYPLCPQQIHISDLMKAIRNIAIREGREPPGPFAKVNEELCSGCGMCATACTYGSIELVPASASGNGHMVAQVDTLQCMDCGICAATCPSEAISVEEFSREKVAVRMQAGGWLQSDIEPKIILFICDWCLRAEDDLARLRQFPPHIRVVNVPCTGQLDSSLISAALTRGADGVLIVGCQPGECHYQRGNLLARRRTMELRSVLAALGVGEERLRLEWISSSERGKIERTVQDFTQTVEQLGQNPLNGKGRHP